jgi:hypothetical protein
LHDVSFAECVCVCVCMYVNKRVSE